MAKGQKFGGKDFVKGDPRCGRPVGSRNRLATAFLDAMYADFLENGVDAIKKARIADPPTYIRVVAGILPRELEIKKPLSDLNDEELARAVDVIRSAIASTPGGFSDGAEAPASGKPH